MILKFKGQGKSWSFREGDNITVERFDLPDGVREIMDAIDWVKENCSFWRGMWYSDHSEFADGRVTVVTIEEPQEPMTYLIASEAYLLNREGKTIQRVF